jgi:hypothetical protein
MFGGPWKEKEKNPFHIFSFPSPNKFYLNLFFFIDFNVLLYHGFKPLFFYTFPSLQPLILI